jgi:hypothetical protein
MARIKTTRYIGMGFVALTVVALFVLLHQNNRYIAQLYALQTLEQEHAQLEAQLEALMQHRARVQSRDVIAAYATQELNLKPIRLQSVHSIADIS